MRRALIVALWLAGAVACGVIVARAPYTGDLTAFLPRAATPAQEMLVAQLREGVAARLLLIGIEGADESALADTSRSLARRLRASGDFAYVANGEAALAAHDQAVLFEQRYLLSPAVDPARFSEPALRAALERALELLASPAGVLARTTLARDPTGELFALLAAHADRPQPPLREGVWFDPGRRRALLMAETRAAGFDFDAQAGVLARLAAAFEAARGDTSLRLLVTGPAVFAVESRRTVERDARRLALVAALGVAAVLYAAYRRAALVAFAALPVATGMLAGVAAVAAGFGTVHGITLGFGATLIGEAADYSTYLFAQRAPSEALAATAARVWPTLRLAVLTTVFGSLAMLLSGFPGLAQLGLLTFAGALAAGLTTRYLLPALVPARWSGAGDRAPPVTLDALAIRARRLAWLVPAALALATAVLALRGGELWERDLERLSPVAAEAKALDQSLREALGAPDVRHLVVVQAPTREALLQRLEALEPTLRALVERGVMRGFDTPARYLPSAATQRARQAAIPPADELARRLAAATRGLPFRAGLFAPFLADAERARNAAPVTAAELDDTAWGLALRALVTEIGGRPAGLVPLAAVADPAALAAAIGALADPAVVALDLKAEAEALVSGYRDESLALWAIGLAAIALVLAAGLRDARAVARVIVPVLAAIASAAAVLALAGVRLSLLHLVALLLVLGIGTNYSLFFGRFVPGDAARRRNAYAVAVAAATTLVAFGVLATSATPILRAIGATVALGAALSLVFAAAWAQPPAE